MDSNRQHQRFVIAALFLIAVVDLCLAFDWRDGGKWAMDCDLPGQDMDKISMRGEDCGGKCASTPGCTHFAWRDWNGGTCFLKQGARQKSDAIWVQGAVCGFPNGDNAPAPGPGPAPAPAPSGGGLVSQSEFESAVTGARPSAPYPKPSAEQYNNFVSRAEKAGRITTKRELAMFLTNILWESDGLKAKQEYTPGDYPNPPLDVPGKKYFGRGYMQLTWSYNYKAASQALYGDDRLLQNPDQVASDDKIAWDTAFWFWSANVHDKPGVQDGKFGATVKAINSMECTQKPDLRAKRFEIYKNIFRLWNIGGQPDESGC